VNLGVALEKIAPWLMKHKFFLWKRKSHYWPTKVAQLLV
jgi:hypothetical protein